LKYDNSEFFEIFSDKIFSPKYAWSRIIFFPSTRDLFYVLAFLYFSCHAAADRKVRAMKKVAAAHPGENIASPAFR